MASDAKELEILVKKIQKQLAPDAEVLHDVRLPGAKSKRDRQIDVLVRQKIGQYEMLIAMECKDYSRKVDVKGVEEFHGLVDDVGAHKGVLVCPRGFSDAAKERAKGLQIDVYSPVDTDPHKWQAKVSAPAICDFRSGMFAIQLTASAPRPLALPMDFMHSLPAFDAEGRELGLTIPTAVRRWEAGELPTDAGEYDGIPVFGQPEVFVDNGYGQRTPITLTMVLHVQRQLYFGQMPIERLTGFRDELSGMVITNAFQFRLLDPDTVLNSWVKLASIEEAPIKPLLILQGLIGRSVGQ